ncbi:MAG: tryptophan synthase subunit alpha [Bacteroidota bacterium]
MNRIEALFQEKADGILNVYFTAGYPQLESTGTVLKSLSAAGADLIEVGIPFSDPLADGPTIQASNQQALDNGMTLSLLFEQVKSVRAEVEAPIIFMGYFNQVMQYGEEEFCQSCVDTGVDGLILPDLPLEVYESEYRALFDRYGLGISFLVTPQTDEVRIRRIDAMSRGFIYAVSSAATTGGQGGISSAQLDYFQRLRDMELRTPHLIGFGVATAEDYQRCCRFSRGAIVGSAFIRAVTDVDNVAEATEHFVNKIKS